jgi:glycosyltransferase involved in cell wall biosynthesis
MPIPRITVAVITYNRSRFLKETLAGLVKQDYPSALWELLVIDNNSTDDTAEVVASFMSAPPFPRRVVETRQGLDHGRNRAISEAMGEIIVLADDDILMPSDWLSKLVAPFASEKAHTIGVVGGEVIPVFPDGLPKWMEGAHRPLSFRKDAGVLPADQSPMGANFAFPKWVFAKLGTFRTELDRQGTSLFGGGDTEMIRRVRASGLEVWFVPEAKVFHQMPASRLSMDYAMRHAFDSARSRVVDEAGIIAASGRSAAPFYISRAVASILKLIGYMLMATGYAVIFQPGKARRTMVRAWRCCGYLYQISRSSVGKI